MAVTAKEFDTIGNAVAVFVGTVVLVRKKRD
jgi:hypothetical protein